MAHRLLPAFVNALADAGLQGTASVTDDDRGIVFRFARVGDRRGDEITCGGHTTERRTEADLVAFAARTFKNVCTPE